jgi:zinc/manganese transport system substrate-binding protein
MGPLGFYTAETVEPGALCLRRSDVPSLKIMRVRPSGLGIVLASLCCFANAAPLNVVAAENIYGDVAHQLGGDSVAVASILNNPAQDPHLFEAGASVARALAGAELAIYNGADYDPWMPKLLAATGRAGRATIVAADLAHIESGANPHLWYDPKIVRMVAKAIADDLTAADPDRAAGYGARLRDFDLSLMPLFDRIAEMRAKYAGLPVTATEPVFEYMAEAIGLRMRNAAFQRAVMNDTEPSARDVGAFEDDLRNHKVKVLLYNLQSAGTLSQHMRRIADEAKIPVVGVSETEPPDMRYQDWMAAELTALDKALAASAP